MENVALLSHPSVLWGELVTAALLGVERRSLTLPSAGGELGAALAGIEAADQAGALLSAAALVALYQRAGQLPTREDAPAAPACLPDPRRACSPQSARHLSAMLGDTQRALLPEWLAALVGADRCLPSALLPELLELGRNQPSLREAILPALGERGRWLAAQNPDWSYASAELRGKRVEPKDSTASPVELLVSLPSQLSADWETGTRAARLALLTELRRREPAPARELVASTWASEKSDDRSAFLAALDTGLSMDDEPFLESALDDRSKEVRHNAALLLARLPDSRLAQRMRTRIAPLLAWVPGEKPRLLGLRPAQPARLEVVLPEECDKAMIRDGIEPKPPSNRQSLGAKAWWLLQILRAIPPATWCQQWGVTPAQLMTIAEQSEWSAVLQEGWLSAALAARDALWAEEMLRAEPSYTDLLDLLRPARQEALLLQILRADCTPLHKHPVLALLRQTHHSWSVELARAALSAIYRHMRKWQDTYDYQLRSAITEDFARRIPPALLEEVAGGWPTDAAVRERWQGVIDRLLITLQFRRDMLQALRAE